MSRFWATLLVIGFVLLLPILSPLAFLGHAVHLHRLRRAADQFKCIRCGHRLGRGSIQLADTAWAKQMGEARRQNPDVKLRIDRKLHAVCTVCGTEYRFVEKKRAFIENSVTDTP